MKKFAFIGGGSFGFTRKLVKDILTFPAFQDAEIALMDIDEERLGYIELASGVVFPQPPSKWFSFIGLYCIRRQHPPSVTVKTPVLYRSHILDPSSPASVFCPLPVPF